MIRDEVSSSTPSTQQAHEVRRSTGSRTFRVLANPALLLWNLMLVLLSPALVAMKLHRFRKKIAPQEFSEKRWSVDTRLKDASLSPHLVFVAASYGEVLLVQRMTEAIRDNWPSVRITWAIRDPVTYQQFKAKKPDQSLAIQPFDSAIPVARWLRRVRPDAVLLMERYNFPNLVAASHLWGSKVILVNGRAKGAYQKAGGLVRSYYRWVFGSYDALLFQSEADTKKAGAVVPAKTRLAYTGNIKLDLVATQIDPARSQSLRQWLASDLPLVAAGSTDDLEEDRFVLDAFQSLLKRKACRLILAPRSLDRPLDLVQEIERRGLTVSVRSKNGPPADVYILDTMGELAYAYGLCVMAYVGGSLHGMGHNVAEPLEWGVPVCYGPERGHFVDLQVSSERAGVGFRVRTPNELADCWHRALTDPAFRELVRGNSKQMLDEQRGALDRSVRHVMELIKPLA